MAERRRRWRWSLVVVSKAALLERADEALLPAVYREVGAALGASPTTLGYLTLCRSFVQAVCYPLAMYAAARYDRARVVAVGAILWAAATLLVGVSGSVLQMALARGSNGVGLALAVPAIYSLVADYSSDATRGSAFGASSASLAGASRSSWVALLSVAIAAMVWAFASDPRPSVRKDAAARTATLADLLREAKDVARVPTFGITVVQGTIGSIQWSAFSFFAMLMELIGFTHLQTSVVTGMSSLANLLGMVLTAATIPLAAVLLLAFPNDPSFWGAYAVACFAFAFVVCWYPVSTNNPIFAEIVPEKARTTVYALGMFIGSVFSSFGSPLVGILAERVFGYQSDRTPGKSAEADRKNATALSKAMCSEIAVPIGICCLMYTALYWTYPKDKQRAQMAALQDQDGDGEASVVDDASAAHGSDHHPLLPGTEPGNNKV
nr:unnamed protein product [Digitaria exilis]